MGLQGLEVGCGVIGDDRDDRDDSLAEAFVGRAEHDRVGDVGVHS